MKGICFIDGENTYTTLGIFIIKGSYDNLVAFPPAKESDDKNDWPEEDGINLSMEQYQVSATEYMKIDEAPVVSHESDVVQNATATITNTVSVMWDDSESDNVNGKNFQRVITQKWIANYPLGLEAWAEYRRTGYPELYPCIDNLSDCGVSSQRGMRRLSFPYTEAQNNKANYDLGVAELGGADNEATDLKWAKKN